MSWTTEWADAASLVTGVAYEPPGVIDDGESINEQPALVHYNGCSHRYVIEGTVADLRAMLAAALAQLPEENLCPR